MKFFLSLLLAASPSSIAQEVISVHGSGTTNPQKCYWDIMDTLMKQSKQPIRFTYRGVGSSTGQSEFLGDDSYNPYNDFGSGDIPLSEEKFKSITGAGVEILHLPVMMGAIGFFHSVDTGGKKLNLTPCVLAKILDRKIIDWSDDEIKKINAGLSLPSTPINVARRVKGSSSTASITTYLNKVCEDSWPTSLVGKEIAWKEDTMKCEGSSGMTDCIRNFPGTIGYIDAGHGHSENLSEIELMNADGDYISSKEASIRDGILEAALATTSGVPSELDQSFAGVNLLNQVRVIFKIPQFLMSLAKQILILYLPAFTYSLVVILGPLLP
jgi:ABC-type phosphate transport system substrate-binding protein